MAEIARTLQANGLSVEATELIVSQKFDDDLSVRGVIDLVARDAKGTPVMVDLKWTRNAKDRLDELKSGRAVQLSTYGAMLAGDQGYQAGYFLLNQREFATLSSSGLAGRQIDGSRTLPETWNAIVATWKRWRQNAAQDGILAMGVNDAVSHAPVDLQLMRDVHCERCDFSTLCRTRSQS